MTKEFIGEFFGTFILVFIGLSSVAVSVAYGAYGLFECGILWGLAVVMGIFVSRSLSAAHLNPAVTLAMTLTKRFEAQKVPVYVLAQFVGAFTAAALVYLVFNNSIETFEQANGFSRGEAISIKSAMIFGEFFPNPGFNLAVPVSMWAAFLTEIIGTAILLFMIITLTENNKPDDNLTPVYIGLVVTILVCLIAPISQCCLNPARDLAPRLFSYFAGWGSAVFPGKAYEVIVVYVAGPVVGAILGAAMSKLTKKIAA
jgi:glycerol uptake facilitator protein